MLVYHTHPSVLPSSPFALAQCGARQFYLHCFRGLISLGRVSCCSPILCVSIAAPRLRPLQLPLDAPPASASASAPRLRSLMDYRAFASVAAPRLRPVQLPLLDCVPFSCRSSIASRSVAAPRLRPVQLLLPECIRFTCTRAVRSTATIKYEGCWSV